MSKFVISLAIEVDADDHEDAYAIQEKLIDFIQQNRFVEDVVEIDVEEQ